MKSYERLEQDIENYGKSNSIERIIDGLTRVTSQYTGDKLEEIKTQIIKSDLFAYVFSSEYYPPYYRTTEVT